MLDLIYKNLPVMPEIWVLTMACVILLTGVFFKKQPYLIYILAQLTVIASAWVTMFAYSHTRTVSYFFHDSFIWDHLAIVMKSFTYVVVFFCFMFVKEYNEEHDIPTHEFYVLSLLSMLGMMVLISAANLLTLYLGLELMSLPIYAMVALKRYKLRCLEAAVKYFVIGALASGLLLYGFSLLFGISGSLQLHDIASRLANLSSHQSLLAVCAMVFVIAGVAFKLGAVPFHMWVPDVYDGAPNSVTLFLSSAPKLAAFVLLTRLLLSSLLKYSILWHEMLIVIAVLSIVLGNLSAIVQVNIKRMLAYSSIAHIGYMLLGFCAANQRGYSSAMFYILNYVFMSVAAFGLLTAISRRGVEVTDIKDLAGMNERNPWLAFMMLLVLFSLAGVPPLVGFIAKIGVLEALIQAHLVWLAVLAIIFAIVGVYYYINVVKVMYFSEVESPQRFYVSAESNIAISITGIALLLLGVFPGALFGVCRLLF